MKTVGFGGQAKRLYLTNGTSRVVRPGAARRCPICSKIKKRWAVHGKYCLGCEFDRCSAINDGEKAYRDIDRFLSDELQRRKEKAWSKLKNKNRRAV